MASENIGFCNITQDQWEEAFKPYYTDIPSRMNSNYKAQSVGFSIMDYSGNGGNITNVGMWISSEIMESEFKMDICDIKYQAIEADDEVQICFIKVFLKTSTSFQQLQRFLKHLQERFRKYEEKDEEYDNYHNREEEEGYEY